MIFAVVLFGSAICGQQGKKPSEPYWDSVYSRLISRLLPHQPVGRRADLRCLGRSQPFLAHRAGGVSLITCCRFGLCHTTRPPSGEPLRRAAGTAFICAQLRIECPCSPHLLRCFLPLLCAIFFESAARRAHRRPRRGSDRPRSHACVLLSQLVRNGPRAVKGR